MDAHLDQEIADSLGCAPELLPHVPRLFVGLDAIGSEPDSLVSVLRPFAGELAGAMVLEPGCGFGAPGRVLARECGAQVLGVDAFAPFLDEARQRAEQAGVADRCRYRHDDLARMLQAEGRFDGVLWMGMGTRLGDLAATVRSLRRVVRPGGWVILDGDAPERDGQPDPLTARAAVTAAGDELMREVAVPPWQCREAARERVTRLRAAGEAMAAEDPFAAASVLLYLERQRGAAEAAAQRHLHIWVLRRRD